LSDEGSESSSERGRGAAAAVPAPRAAKAKSKSKSSGRSRKKAGAAEPIRHRPNTDTLNPRARMAETVVAAAPTESAPARETRPAVRTTILPKQQGSIAGAGASTEQPRYDEIRLLGEGASGDVVLTRDCDIDRMVALKRLRAANSKELTARFAREIQIIGRLEHPHITPVHDVGVDAAGRYFFVMKYVDGETLESVIDKLMDGDPAYHARYTFEYRTQIFLKILDAIDFAHARGVIHRDIKPANVMIGPFGEVVVMDWGVARQVADADPDEPSTTRVDAAQPSTVTREDALVGTPAYMSPEQARGENATLDVRSDVYSLCAMFYELLTLRYYLADKVDPDASLVAVVMAVLLHEPVTADQVSNPYQGTVPRELSFFLMRGLQKSRDDRFANVREMIAELKNNLDGKICVYCTSTALKRGVMEYAHLLDRHRKIGVVVAVSVAVFALLGIVLGIRLLV